MDKISEIAFLKKVADGLRIEAATWLPKNAHPDEFTHLRVRLDDRSSYRLSRDFVNANQSSLLWIGRS